MSESAATTGAVTNGRLVVRVALRTDVGKIRSENQDFATFTRPDEEAGRRPGGRLMIVADGMGGHRGGATASRLAGETVKQEYLGASTDDVPGELRDALRVANAKIFAEAQANVDLRGMGTTTSALVIRNNVGWFGHVGDSRIYLARGDEIRQLTDDHSLVATMVREGLLTSKEAENHPRRNVLQRSIGVSEDVDVDIRGPLDLQEGDTFILCSDGLHGMVKEDELGQIAKLPIDQAADECVKRALERGAPDNVTVIVARVEREADVAEKTLVEKTLVEREDRVLFDETVREMTSRSLLPAARGEGGPERAKRVEGPDEGPSPAASPHPLPQAGEGTPTTPSRGGSVVKWALLFVVVLGAAGAWLFWTQQQGFARQTTQSSHR